MENIFSFSNMSIFPKFSCIPFCSLRQFNTWATCILSADCKTFLQTSLILVGEIGGNEYNYAFVQGTDIEVIESLLLQLSATSASRSKYVRTLFKCCNSFDFPVSLSLHMTFLCFCLDIQIRYKLQPSLHSLLVKSNQKYEMILLSYTRTTWLLVQTVNYRLLFSEYLLRVNIIIAL